MHAYMPADPNWGAQFEFGTKRETDRDTDSGWKDREKAQVRAKDRETGIKTNSTGCDTQLHTSAV